MILPEEIDDVLFKDVCKYLRNAAPDEWNVFVQMFTQYTAEAVEAVSLADASMIMEAKGRANGLKAVRDAFRSCADEPSSP